MEREARRARPGSRSGGDPFEALRALVQRAERDVNELLTGLTRGGVFGSALGAWQRAELGARRAARGAFGWWFASLNLPTRSDVLRLGRRLAEIEQQLARLEDELAASRPREPAARTDTGARPARTRKPPLRPHGPPAPPRVPS